MMVFPFVLHGFLMVVDERIHQQRGLNRWERWGHPLDTLTVLACFLFVFNVEFSEINKLIYLGLALFSSLFVTKDEWVHAKECGAFEQWLHSLLFILHPVLLFILYHFWSTNSFPSWSYSLPYGVFMFGCYQFVYWNFLRGKSD